jgi:predicted aconitase
MTDTCINYQTIMPPVLGEHLAFGDTGSSIYANSVQGARTNFQGGPSALASALTGRAPRYGFHLDECRKGRKIFKVDHAPSDFAEWGALGGVIGRQMESYWDVPVIELVSEHRHPTSDELKHFGAALASYGSTALFHMIGVTPEAFDGSAPLIDDPEQMGVIGTGDIEAFIEAYWPQDDVVDVVVFAAPQLSLIEISQVADLLDGQTINDKVALIATVSPEVKSAADRMGMTAKIEGSGGLLLQGVCFYQMCAREIGEAKGWKRLLTNSAKLVNIIGGYGYEPVLASLECCVRSAVQGRLVR